MFTNLPISRKQILELRNEATEAGDSTMLEVCELALGDISDPVEGPVVEGAQRHCFEVILAAFDSN